jgi:hypothetical protein
MGSAMCQLSTAPSLSQAYYSAKQLQIAKLPGKLGSQTNRLMQHGLYSLLYYK